jgi:hypothetical protein
MFPYSKEPLDWRSDGTNREAERTLRFSFTSLDENVSCPQGGLFYEKEKVCPNTLCLAALATEKIVELRTTSPKSLEIVTRWVTELTFKHWGEHFIAEYTLENWN